MNILLIGERYSANLGDGVIYDTVAEMCKEIYGENLNISCLDISGNTNFKTSSLVEIKKEKIKFLLSKIRKVASRLKRESGVKKRLSELDLKNIDGAIFVGGQLFAEYFSKQIYMITKTLFKYHIPVIFNCCGVGKNDKKRNIEYLKEALSLDNVKAISLRDNYDTFIEKYKINKKVEVVMDPVIEIANYFSINSSPEKIVGLGVMHPKLYAKNNINYPEEYYYKLFQVIIERLEQEQIKWEFFCNGNVNDYEFAKKICHNLKIEDDKIAKRPVTPKELIENIGKYNFILSFRLHSHIIATSFEIPTIGFCWDKKLNHFGKSIKRSDYFIEIDDNILENVNKKIDGLLKDKYEKGITCKYSSDFLKEYAFEVKK